MSSSAVLLPNPYTPMAYLSPLEGQVHQVSAYVYFAAIGALAWDWLMSMPDEYRMLSTGRMTISKAVYICARVFTFAFCLCSVVFQVAPVTNCEALMHATTTLTVLSLNANNLLFFVRVRAVYGNSRRVSAFFGFLYMIVLSVSMYIPFSLSATNIGPTQLCTEINVKPWASSSMFCNAAYDTLVFLAISYRISSQSVGGDGWRSRFRSFFYGDGAPRIVKDLLHNGQLCYFATIVLTITQIVTALGTPYVVMLTIPTIALENAMTCRVHRACVLGLINGGGGGSSASSPFVLTTVMGADSMVLKERESDFKGGFEQQEGQIESASDRV
ncbi:hypothetical protein FIBSPDRAFT_875303 [Athelia psychrophila]|uniref:DUF6533 domain-containing protein n=1 Tax=Athelia psychrophila TaxID=1759441 RepID=A0A165WH86_9AGAM|nr:hypothetical protein FIBSPDRAFT_875303 [Fibularhizoctonia sp. CBS 109695]